MEAKSAGTITPFVLGVVTLIIGAVYNSINSQFNPEGFYLATAVLFGIGIFMVFKTGGKSSGSFKFKTR